MASVLGQYTPSGASPKAFTSGPVTALRIQNGSAFDLRVVLGGQVFDKVPAGADQTYPLANLTGYGGWVLLVPGFGPVQGCQLRGPVILTSYGGGDTIPYGTATQLSEAVYQPVFDGRDVILDSLRGDLRLNARMFGCRGDGVTDDTAALQALLDALNVTTGELALSAGTYLTGTLTLYSNVTLAGGGSGNTILKQKAGANGDVLQGQNFLTLTGTNNSAAGIHHFAVRDLTIDGNKAANSSGYGLRVYGYTYNLRNVITRNCANDGIYSEWATGGPPVDSMEAYLTNVKSHDNLGHGIQWAGPHDSVWDAVWTFLNGTAGDGHAGIYIRNSATVAGGGQIANSHSWGNSQSWALKSEANLSLSNNYWEGAQSAQVLLTGSDASHTASGTIMVGDRIEGVGVIAAPVGIEIGAGGIPVAGVVTRGCKINGCTSGAVKLTNDGGVSTIDASIFQTSGSITVGAPASTTVLALYVAGFNATTRTPLYGHTLSKGPAPTLGALKAGVTSQSIAGNDTAGVITLTTTGAPPAAGAVVADIVFNLTFGTTPQVFISAGGTPFLWSGSSITGFSLVAGVTLAGTTTYTINYLIVG